MSTNSGPAFIRQQLLVDRVQGSLLWRTAFYSIACAVYFIVILVFTELMSRPDETLSDAMFRCLDEAIYWAPGLILLAPLVAYDMLKMTNRFAGPVFRLRRELQRLVDGTSEYPLTFRDGDYWTEMAEPFNKLRTELMELRAEKLEAQAVRPVSTTKPLMSVDETSEIDDLLMN